MTQSVSKKPLFNTNAERSGSFSRALDKGSKCP